MKRILLALLIGTSTLLTLGSCTKEYNTYTLPSKTFIYTVKANQWTGNGNNISTVINLPELDKRYLLQGAATVAISFDNESSYYSLPMTNEAVAYSFMYQMGKITMYAQDPILENGVTITPPTQIVVKVTLTDADYVE